MLHALQPRKSTSATLPPSIRSDPDVETLDMITNTLCVQVSDISGGCGSMYRLEIESAKFAGLSVIKQHKMVNAVLKEEIKGWHGVQLKTKAA
jgi:stress-induced morphogen